MRVQCSLLASATLSAWIPLALSAVPLLGSSEFLVEISTTECSETPSAARKSAEKMGFTYFSRNSPHSKYQHMGYGCMPANSPKVSFALLSVSRERGLPRFPWSNHAQYESPPNSLKSQENPFLSRERLRGNPKRGKRDCASLHSVPCIKSLICPNTSLLCSSKLNCYIRGWIRLRPALTISRAWPNTSACDKRSE